MKKNKKLLYAILLLNIMVTACAEQRYDQHSNSYNAVNPGGIAGESMVSSDAIFSYGISENAINTDAAEIYEGRPISYNVEDYIFLSMEETYAWLAPFGFCIRDGQEEDTNWICRYTEDGKEDRVIQFGYSNTGRLEHIYINDFGEAKEEWTLYGMNCRMSGVEMEEWVKRQGAAVFGHNMVLYGTGVGLEKLGIGMIRWGCSDISIPMDYMDIDINTAYVDFLQDIIYEIENQRMEFMKEDGTTFSIEYPVFGDGEEEIFYAMNEQLLQLVEENGETLCRENNRENIVCEIECLETRGISLSFYRSGDYHFQSVFTFNYNLAEGEILPMPDYFQEKLEIHREMLGETGACSILNWYINPMQAHIVYYNQISGEEAGLAFWRK